MKYRKKTIKNFLRLIVSLKIGMKILDEVLYDHYIHTNQYARAFLRFPIKYLLRGGR